VSLLGRLSVVGARAAGPAPAGLLEAARRERTLPLVCRALGRPCPEERDILARQLVARAQAEAIAARVEVLALKGLHLAHRLYPSPGLRDMGDLDLLVRRDDLRAADAALRALGYAAWSDPERVAAAGGGFLNAVEYAHPDGLPVHLHWHVLNGSLPHAGAVDLAEIWRDARDGALARHHLLVTLCEHALKHSFDALIHLSDIELAGRDADWEKAADVARRWKLSGAVRLALVLVRDLLGKSGDGLRILGEGPVGPEGRWLLAQARRRRPGGSWLGYLALQEGWGGRLSFVRRALAPGAEGEGLRTRSLGGRVARVLGAWLGG
jgi:hypothetical protein